jgi:hypothetical protein
MEELPTLERISLEDGALIPERLCGSEKGEHDPRITRKGTRDEEVEG